jgi:predicted transcriptional regulator of viral defense system
MVPSRHNDRLEFAKPKVVRLFDTSSRKIYRLSQLNQILSENWREWQLPISLTRHTFVEFLLHETSLKQIVLESERYMDEIRFVWGSVSDFAIALSIRNDSYLSHGSAAFLHDLTGQEPNTIYVNREQSRKGQRGTLSQEAIHRAFRSQQRYSKQVYTFGTKKLLLISGKNSGRLGVEPTLTRGGEVVDATNLERTMIDISVRPSYAGGIYEVLKAFIRAKGRLSIEITAKTLAQLDFLYPYHQLIGFLMERAGYDELDLQRLQAFGTFIDFYAAYDLKDPQYNRRWRLFHPADI